MVNAEQCMEQVSHDATKLFQKRLSINDYQTYQLRELAESVANKGWHSVRFGVLSLIAIQLLKRL